MRSRLAFAAATALAVGGLAPAAHATFPGKNGKIAFQSTRAIAGVCDPCAPKIYTMNADGTGVTRLDPAGVPADAEKAPEWSPTGTQIAYDRASTVTKINSDGSGRTPVVSGEEPTWSPDAAQLAYTRLNVYTVNANGSGEFAVTNNAGCTTEDVETFCTFYSDPSWAPDGVPLVWEFQHSYANTEPPRVFFTSGTDISGGGTSVLEAEGPDWSPNATQIVFATHVDDEETEHRAQVGISAPNGAGRVLLTGQICASRPAWSPDGSKIVFAAGGGPCGGDSEIYVMNANGSNVVPLTDNTYDDAAPSWQSVPVNSYPRPKSATEIRAPLVPAYRACGASTPQANRIHGPPLTHPSCAPPVRRSAELTIGTLDSNGYAASSQGYVRMRQIGETPPLDPNNGDQADVAYELDFIDVRKASDGSDYGGELLFEISAQITDRDNTPSPAPSGAATMQLTVLSVTAPCTPTPDRAAIGSTCHVSTTADALVPGTVKEGKRAVWELGHVRVLDGGPDGDAETEPNTLFASQGIFVP